jgi:hypothetical protein
MKFTPQNPAKPWTGRYARIPGKEPAFHVSSSGVITAQWTDYEEDERLTAPIHDSPGAKALAKALNETKARLTGHAGGSFLINEHRQVICPIAGSYSRFWVGQIDGDLVFKHPVDGGTVSLAPPRNTSPGRIWKGPYIGMKFNLSGDDRIYFNHEQQDTKQKLWLNKPNSPLIRSLRMVRASGGVRFIVNHHGAVFTKLQDASERWTPVFVSYIDPVNWYPLEG